MSPNGLNVDCYTEKEKSERGLTHPFAMEYETGFETHETRIKTAVSSLSTKQALALLEVLSSVVFFAAVRSCETHGETTGKTATAVMAATTAEGIAAIGEVAYSAKWAAENAEKHGKVKISATTFRRARKVAEELGVFQVESRSFQRGKKGLKTKATMLLDVDVILALKVASECMQRFSDETLREKFMPDHKYGFLAGVYNKFFRCGTIYRPLEQDNKKAGLNGLSLPDRLDNTPKTNILIVNNQRSTAEPKGLYLTFPTRSLTIVEPKIA